VIRRQSAALIGTQLWAMELEVYWCWAFGVVRTIQQAYHVDCCGPAWSFDRWISVDLQGVGGPSARSFVQAQFRYSLAWFQGSKAPWILITVHGDGTAERSWG
jgi:hypothetical protein